MKKIRIGQIGTQHDHAVGAFESICRQSDVFEVVGYALETPYEGEIPNPTTRSLHDCYKGYKCYTVQELLDAGLDAVVIETSDLNLTKYAEMALARGLHVQMDKPGGIGQAEFERMTALAEEKGLVLHLGYMYRYNPAVIEALARVRAGEIGEVTRLEAYMNCLHPADKRAWLSQFPGGMLYYLGCHLLDLALLFRGEPDGILPLSTSSGLDGVTALDNGFAVLKYKNGVSVIGTSAVEVAGFCRRQLVVVGSLGTIELYPIEKFVTPAPDAPACNMSTSWRITPREEAKSWNDIAAFRDIPPINRYDGMLRAFASYVRGEAENPYTPEYERRLHRWLLRACGNELAE